MSCIRAVSNRLCSEYEVRRSAQTAAKRRLISLARTLPLFMQPLNAAQALLNHSLLQMHRRTCKLHVSVFFSDTAAHTPSNYVQSKTY